MMKLLRIFSGFQVQSDNYFLKPHELAPVHGEPILLKPEQPFWLLVILLLIVGLMMAVRIFYRKSFLELISAFFSFRYSVQLIRDENILLQRATIVLTIIFTLTLALFLYQADVVSQWKLPFTPSGFNAYIFFALIISAIYAFKFMVLKIAGFIFDIAQEMETYVFTVFLINNMFGLLLLPVVVINFLYPSMPGIEAVSFSILGLACIFLLYRLVRGVLISRESPYHSSLYLFFYLCALEIAPLLVLVKVLVRQ